MDKDRIIPLHLFQQGGFANPLGQVLSQTGNTLVQVASMPVDVGSQEAVQFAQIQNQREALQMRRMQFREQMEFSKKQAERSNNLAFLKYLDQISKNASSSAGTRSKNGNVPITPITKYGSTVFAANEQQKLEAKEGFMNRAIEAYENGGFDDIQGLTDATLGYEQDLHKIDTAPEYQAGIQLEQKMAQAKKTYADDKDDGLDDDLFREAYMYNMQIENPEDYINPIRTDTMKDVAQSLKEMVDEGYAVPKEIAAMNVQGVGDYVNIFKKYKDFATDYKDYFLNKNAEYKNRNQQLYKAKVANGKIDPEQIDFDQFHEAQTESDIMHNFSDVPTVKDEGLKKTEGVGAPEPYDGPDWDKYDTGSTSSLAPLRVDPSIKGELMNFLGHKDQNKMDNQLKLAAEGDAASINAVGGALLGTGNIDAGFVQAQEDAYYNGIANAIALTSPGGTIAGQIGAAVTKGKDMIASWFFEENKGGVKMWTEKYENLSDQQKKIYNGFAQLTGLDQMSQEELNNMDPNKLFDMVKNKIAYQAKGMLSVQTRVRNFTNTELGNMDVNSPDDISRLSNIDIGSPVIHVLEDKAVLDGDDSTITWREAQFLKENKWTLSRLSNDHHLHGLIRGATSNDATNDEVNKYANGLVYSYEGLDKDGNVQKGTIIIPASDAIAIRNRAANQLASFERAGMYTAAFGKSDQAFDISFLDTLGNGKGNENEIIDNLLSGSYASKEVYGYLQRNNITFKQTQLENGVGNQFTIQGSDGMPTVNVVGLRGQEGIGSAFKLAQKVASISTNGDDTYTIEYMSRGREMGYKVTRNGSKSVTFGMGANNDKRLADLMNDSESKPVQKLKWRDANGDLHDTAGTGRVIDGFTAMQPMLSDNYDVTAKLHTKFINDWKKVDQQLGALGLRYHINSIHRTDDINQNHSIWAMDLKLSRDGVENQHPDVEDLWPAFNQMIDSGELELINRKRGDQWKSWRLKGTDLYITPHENDNGVGYHYHIEYDKNLRSKNS